MHSAIETRTFAFQRALDIIEREISIAINSGKISVSIKISSDSILTPPEYFNRALTILKNKGYKVKTIGEIIGYSEGEPVFNQSNSTLLISWEP